MCVLLCVLSCVRACVRASERGQVSKLERETYEIKIRGKNLLHAAIARDEARLEWVCASLGGMRAFVGLCGFVNTHVMECVFLQRLHSTSKTRTNSTL